MPKKSHHQDQPGDRIGDILDHSLKRLDLAPRLESYGIWPVWNEVVGDPIARNAQPERIRNGTLFVKVSSPVWMQQLQFMKDLVREKLNQRLRAAVVKNIFFVVGNIANQQAVAEEKAAHIDPTAADVLEIDEGFLDSVRDSETRQALKKLLRSYARRRKKS